MNTDVEQHFLDFPEIHEVLELLYPSLLGESDRGAVLVALSVIDNQIDSLFEASLPKNTSNNRKKEIFNLTGPFGSLSSKLDIAYTCRMLPDNLVNAIHILRKLRNDAAHQSSDFNLIDQENRIKDAYITLGDSVSAGMRRLAANTIGNRVMASLEALEDSVDPRKSMFSNREEIIEALKNHPDAFDVMNSQLPKHELIFATHLICGLIFMWQRKYMLLHA